MLVWKLAGHRSLTRSRTDKDLGALEGYAKAPSFCPKKSANTIDSRVASFLSFGQRHN
jgi:hypothetical protein